MSFVRGLSYGLATFVLLAFLYLRAPYLYDSDSYLHLAVSRLYTEQGFVQGLPWPRFSVMHDGYGDKELLFHVALIPFVSNGDAATDRPAVCRRGRSWRRGRARLSGWRRAGPRPAGSSSSHREAGVTGRTGRPDAVGYHRAASGGVAR